MHSCPAEIAELSRKAHQVGERERRSLGQSWESIGTGGYPAADTHKLPNQSKCRAVCQGAVTQAVNLQKIRSKSNLFANRTEIMRMGRKTGRTAEWNWRQGGRLETHVRFIAFAKKYAFQLDALSTPRTPCPIMLITINVVNAFCPVGAAQQHRVHRAEATGYRVRRHGKYYRRNLGTLSAARCLLYVRVFLFILLLRFLFYLFISFAPRK